MAFTFLMFEFVKRGRGRPAKQAGARELEMLDYYRSGKTLAEIGALQSPVISRERVRQLLKKYFAVTAKDGGQYLTCTPKKIASEIEKNNAIKAKQSATCLSIFGCSVDEFISINVEKWNRKKGTPATAYYDQRRNAINARKIAWNITFPEWWKIWQDSGHYKERGRGTGYCMSRIGDTGGYEVGNVEIKTIGQNFSESFFKTPMKERYQTAINNGKYKPKTHCIRGHERINDNLTKGGNCKLCSKERYLKKGR